MHDLHIKIYKAGILMCPCPYTWNICCVSFFKKRLLFDRFGHPCTHVCVHMGKAFKTRVNFNTYFHSNLCITAGLEFYGMQVRSHNIARSDGGLETWSCLETSLETRFCWSQSRLGLGPENLGLGLGLVL